MEKLIKKLEKEYKDAEYVFDEVEKYIEENNELPQVDSANDLFEAWYMRGLEVALWIVKEALWK